MLTRNTLRRARRFAASYGDHGPHYFDGRNDPGPPRPAVLTKSVPERSGYMRRTDAKTGAWTYVKNKDE